MQGRANRLQGWRLALSVAAAFALLIGFCGGAALCISFFTSGKPAFLGPVLGLTIPLAIALGGLAGVFYVPIYAGRKLPRWVRLLEIFRYELAALNCLVGSLAFPLTTIYTSLLHSIFTPEALSAIKAFQMQAFPLGFLAFLIATGIKWGWQNHLKIRTNGNRLREAIRRVLHVWPRDV